MNDHRPEPPAAAVWIVRRFAPPRDRLTLLGDLQECFLRRAERDGPTAARRWYWREALAAPFRLRRARGGWLLPSLIEGAVQLRFALRRVARDWAFTAVVILSLAVGIGVNTAALTAIHAVWLAPVPGVEDGDRIVEPIATERGSDQWGFSYPDFDALREADLPFEAVAGWSIATGTMRADDSAFRVTLIHASGDYFRLLGVVPPIGRVFGPDEDLNPGEHPVAVVSHDLWHNELGGDADVLGRTILLNRAPYVVIGVAPKGFRGTRPNSFDADLWVPLTQHPNASGENNLLNDAEQIWVSALARLTEGASIETTNAALETLFTRLARERPTSHEYRSARAARFSRFPAQNRMGDVIGVGMLGALLVLLLLIICANLAGMALVRGARREREHAVRLALGSGRGRLLGHLLTEAGLLALAGGGLGITLAFQGMRLVTPEMLGAATPNVDFEPTLAVLAAALGLTLLAALAFGFGPASRFSSPRVAACLRDDAGAGGRRVGRLHRLAASAQAGAALLLLVVGSLFLRALDRMGDRDFGYEPERLLGTWVELADEGYMSPEQREGVVVRLEQAVAVLPGVETVASADGLPLDRSRWPASVSRGDRDGDRGQVRVDVTRAGVGYLETLGTPLLQGRSFQASDDSGSEPVAIISRALADQLWPGESPLGRTLRWSQIRLTEDEDTRLATVVGVAANVVSSRIDAELPNLFVPLQQETPSRIMLVVRTSAEEGALTDPIRAAMQGVIPSLPVPLILSAEYLVARSTEAQRGIGRMAGGLGILALILATIGVYGVVGLTVAGRTREIGLRIAMGAAPRSIRLKVLGDALRLTIPGLLVGTAAAVGLALLLRGMLVGLKPIDPPSFLISLGLIVAAVAAASIPPARRAASLDPAEALRQE